MNPLKQGLKQDDDLFSDDEFEAFIHESIKIRVETGIVQVRTIGYIAHLSMNPLWHYCTNFKCQVVPIINAIYIPSFFHRYLIKLSTLIYV